MYADVLTVEDEAVPFRIDPNSGTIYLTADLSTGDYRDISSFTLNVSAQDDGSCCASR